MKFILSILVALSLAGCASKQWLLEDAVVRNDTVELNQLLAERNSYDYVHPLNTAVKKGNMQHVQILMEHMTASATQDFAYALNYAAANNHIDMVRLFLDRGADANSVGTFDYVPLCNAAANGNSEIVGLLLERGALPNPPKCFPLIHAVENGNPQVVRMLLNAGSAVNIKDAFSSTALHAAVTKGNSELVKLLVDGGADATLTDGQGKSSLRLAEEKGLYQIVKLLAGKQPAMVGNEYKRMVARNPEAVPRQQTGKARSKADVDTPPALKSRKNPNAYAVVIGIEKYRQGLPNADHAFNDAMVVSNYLTKALGFPEENVITLTNDKATLGDMVKYFEKWLKNNLDQESRLFVYYSGHGAPNPKDGGAYLVPYDGDPAFIDETGYSLKRLYDNLARLQAKNIVVALDACFSGAGGKSVIARGARALVRSEKAAAGNVLVMTASADDQISSSYDEKNHGVFTYFLLKGIKMRLEENKHAKLEVGELYAYIKPQVEKTSRKLYNNEQTPQLIINSDQVKKIGLR